eukprot:12363923-Ditylum_brightwellii.AAC.1
MPKLKKGTRRIAHRRKYSSRKFRPLIVPNKSKYIMSKANEKRHCQIIAFIFQDQLGFPEKHVWPEAVLLCKAVLKLTRNQLPKVCQVFNRCVDARYEGTYYNGERNAFVREQVRVIDSNGIEGQIIVDVLQNGENFQGAAEVSNHWRSKNDKDIVAMSTIKNH